VALVAKHKPNKALQDELRRRIDAGSFSVVAKQCKVDRGTLGQYLANLPMRTCTFIGIEAMAAQAIAGTQTPSSRSTEASDER
jgi:hypothetical protein